jgi:hypothetical protein
MEVWELIARESIRDCIARYNANGDTGRFDEMMTVFAPDAVMEVSGKVIRGHDAIREFFAGVAQRTREPGRAPGSGTGSGAGPSPVEEWVARGRRPFIRHFTSTTQIDVLSETEARARSYYLVVTVHGLDHWGRYIDEYGVVDGRWVITHRTVTTDAAFAGGWGAAAGGASVAEVVTRGLT